MSRRREPLSVGAARRLAVAPDTGARVLVDLAAHPDPVTRAWAVTHPAFPPEELRELAVAEPPDWPALAGAVTAPGLGRYDRHLIRLRLDWTCTVGRSLAGTQLPRWIAGEVSIREGGLTAAIEDYMAHTPPERHSRPEPSRAPRRTLDALAAAREPDTAGGKLVRLLGHDEAMVRYFAAAHPRCTKANLQNRIEKRQPDWAVLYGTAQCPTATPRLLDLAARHAAAELDAETRPSPLAAATATAAVAAEDLPAAPRLLLAERGVSRAGRPPLVAPPEPAPYAGDAGGPHVDALRADTSPERLADLLTHPDAHVRAAAAAHPAAPPASLARAAISDEDPTVRAVAGGHPNTPLDALRIAWERDPAGPAALQYQARTAGAAPSPAPPASPDPDKSPELTL